MQWYPAAGVGSASPCPFPSRSCPHLPTPSPPHPGLGYWAGRVPGPAVAPFSWGILDIWRKVVLMAWWQVSMSLGTSATVRPRVGMASSTSTWTVPVGGGAVSAWDPGGPKVQALGPPACPPGAAVSLLGKWAHHHSLAPEPLARPLGSSPPSPLVAGQQGSGPQPPARKGRCAGRGGYLR